MTSEITVQVGGSPMPILLALPEGAGPHPAVVVMMHRPGVDEFTRGFAERLAKNGFAAAAPNLYHRRPAGEDSVLSRKALNDGEVVADIDATVANLKANRAIRGQALAILGHCMGGRMAFLGAASNPAFKAAGVFYGGGIFVAEGDGRPAPFALARNIKCPIIGGFGKDDTHPSPDDVARISAELKRLDIRHDFRIYDGAGHAFQNVTNPASYREQASEDVWTRLVPFLRAELSRH